MRPSTFELLLSLLPVAVSCSNSTITDPDITASATTTTAPASPSPITSDTTSNARIHKAIRVGPCPDKTSPVWKDVSRVRRLLKDDHGNFMGDTEENDRYGHPDIEKETFVVWVRPETRRLEMYHRSIKLGPEYAIYLVNREPVLICEDPVAGEEVNGDSIYFYGSHVLLWKRGEDQCVNDPDILEKKEAELGSLLAALLRWYDGHAAEPDTLSPNGKMDRLVRTGTE